ncbi:MAG TPA: hypothetical protein IGS17_16790 [Oscillatoriales cyanobacterium M59_W2019_021]|nr:hypothetical protein [Oscillatoriales cyanobacterium M4454_W2019_049]HIK52563.1 hypothetical protein [Oscillatoriales cyanobacterium M59_W2019_021]
MNESITFGVSGTLVNADVSFFNTEKIKLFYGKYLKNPNEFKSTLVRRETRNCFNSWATGLKPEEIVGDKQGKLLKDVQACLNEKFADVGVTFELIGFVSKPRFAQAIEAQITARFQAEQQAIAAKAEAEVARIQQQSATSASIRLRELELQERAIEKWNGVLPMD